MEKEELNKLLEESVPHIKEGQVVRGKVVQVIGKEALVGIGYKSEGLLSLSEFENPKEVEVGYEVDVLVESKEDVEGRVVLSLEKADLIKHWEKLQKSYENAEPVKGKVIRKIKGGFVIDIGVLAFLPSSQLFMEDIDTSKGIVGQEIGVKIIKMNGWRGNIVVSHRMFVEEERERKKHNILSSLKVGSLVKGKVKNITDFGAFIDLGEIDGLLHISDISWGRISHPSEALSIGEELEVVVLDIDKEKERISLGLKQKSPDPWKGIEKKYPIGSKVKGKVVNITHYGIFLELEEGVEGLVHISELSWRKRITHPSQMVSMGDIVEAVVISVDKENKKMALSIKQIEPDPWLQVKGKYSVGSVLKGKVKGIAEHAVYIDIEDGIEGMIPVHELVWSQGPVNPKRIVKKGEIVQAIVTNLDEENRKVILSRKKLLPDPWENVSEKYSVGMEVEGKVTKITDFGAFVEIEEGIEGLLHVSQMGNNKEKTPQDILSVGDKIKVWIVRLSPELRRMGLSMKSSGKEAK